LRSRCAGICRAYEQGRHSQNAPCGLPLHPAKAGGGSRRCHRWRLTIETDGDNLGASLIGSGEASNKAIKVPSLRLRRILEEADVSHVDALRIDIEGFEDRARNITASPPLSLLEPNPGA
jgi:hypothetical protein